MRQKESGAGETLDGDSGATNANRDCRDISNSFRPDRSSPNLVGGLSKNQRFTRGKLALWECGYLDIQELGFYEYMLFKRHLRPVASVDMVTLGALFGSQNRVRRIMNSLCRKIPHLFEVFSEPGKSKKLVRVERYEDIGAIGRREFDEISRKVSVKIRNQIERKQAYDEKRRQKLLTSKMEVRTSKTEPVV